MCVQYRRGFQYREGYHDACEGYLEYCRGYHECRGGVILRTVGDTHYCGDIMMHMGYHEYRGGKIFLLFEYPMIPKTPQYS